MGEHQNPHLHDFGTFERVPEPQKQQFYFWDRKTLQTIQDRSQPIFAKILF